MFRFVFFVFLTTAAAEPSCKGDQCTALDGSTAGSVMLQVSSAKYMAKLDDAQGEEDDVELETDEELDMDDEEEENEEEDIEEKDIEEEEEEDSEGAEELDEEESLEATTSERSGKGRGRKPKGNRRKVTQLSDEDKAACPSGGRLVDGKCWHLSLPATSCEETCVEKDLQYDDATDLGEFTKTDDAPQRQCLSIAEKFGFPGKLDRMKQYGKACGCVVFKIPAYGLGDEVHMYKKTTASCPAPSAIQSRLCACKKAVPIGGSCEVSSGCENSYCKSGTCTALVAQDKACTEHTSCVTGYCSPTESTCTTLAWKPPVRGAFARHYRQSGKKRLQYRKVPNWAEMTTFPKGFCLGYYNKTTGCLVAKGIDKSKVIAKAKQRCAVSAECRAVWCCATGCPATTCYAIKAEAPNYHKADCPDAPGSFKESKYASSFYVKDAAKASASDDTNEGDKDAQEDEDAPAATPDAPDAPDADQDEAKDEEEVNAKIYKLVKSSSSCKFGRGRDLRYQRLKGEETVDECAEAVKQHNGLAFAWMAHKKLCLMAPKPFSACPKYRKGKYDLYELEPGAGDQELQ